MPVTENSCSRNIARRSRRSRASIDPRLRFGFLNLQHGSILSGFDSPRLPGEGRSPQIELDSARPRLDERKALLFRPLVHPSDPSLSFGRWCKPVATGRATWEPFRGGLSVLEMRIITTHFTRVHPRVGRRGGHDRKSLGKEMGNRWDDGSTGNRRPRRSFHRTRCRSEHQPRLPGSPRMRSRKGMSEGSPHDLGGHLPWNHRKRCGHCLLWAR